MAPGKFLSLVTKRGLYTALRGALFWLSHDLVHVEDRNTEIVSKKLFLIESPGCIRDAHCYDPNEEAQLLCIISTLGQNRFNNRTILSYHLAP